MKGGRVEEGCKGGRRMEGWKKDEGSKLEV